MKLVVWGFFFNGDVIGSSITLWRSLVAIENVTMEERIKNKERKKCGSSTRGTERESGSATKAKYKVKNVLFVLKLILLA